MPLHLLGKKSWNVYNKANIEKVRRDEAIAQAAEEAEEERMQALDAERRMQILRGEDPTPIPNIEISAGGVRRHRSNRSEHGYGEKKIRKKNYENDTDFEIRAARQRADDTAAVAAKNFSLGIPMISNDSSQRDKLKKNPEAEKEASQKKREYEDQYTMRFSNAAGYKKSSGESPWYSRTKLGISEADMTDSKDVWGNKDPKRSDRESERILKNDPLLIMKAGAKKVREVEKKRKRCAEEIKNTDKYLKKERKISQRTSWPTKDYNDDINVVSLDDTRDEHKVRKKASSPRGYRNRHRDTDSYHRHRHTNK
ncbi:hypothetical protein Golomagni_02973 [Golovinomyces magnicellulatus]|nr:hypothetical protein Golomagni_02973 [Golovinomyces magnicellulatus]